MSKNVWHITPTNDARDHDETTQERAGGLLCCLCPCKPAHTVLDNGALLIVHDAFDGRLGVEMAREVLAEAQRRDRN